MKAYGAEFFGTFWLVLGGCGSAVLAGAFPEFGIGFLGVSLACGLTVLTMAYAIGHVSGCHLNPAVSVGLWAGGRFSGERLLPYIAAQVLGAPPPARSCSSSPAARLVSMPRGNSHPTGTGRTPPAGTPSSPPSSPRSS